MENLNPTVVIPSLEELLKAGVHFGHKAEKWHPKMAPYIFTKRNDVHIINLEKTIEHLKAALDFVRETSKEGKKIVFVGTKDQAKEIVKKYAVQCGAPYVTGRWLGGTITNFSVIAKLIQKLKDLREKRASGELQKYTKKEQLQFERTIEELEKKVGGIQELGKLPDALFIIDLVHEKTAREEAQRKGIPILAICDTNVNPTGVRFPIPANDAAIQSIEIIVSLVAQAVKEGKEAPPEAEKSEILNPKFETNPNVQNPNSKNSFEH